MIRPLLSLKRLNFDETEGKVRYQHSRHDSQEESMDYLEFIARFSGERTQNRTGWEAGIRTPIP